MPEKVTKADLTKDRLMTLALKEFKKRGFDETSMRDLAEAAELSPGAFYYHFKSKDDVVQAFYEQTFETFLSGAADIFTSTTVFEKRLARTLQLRIETFRDSRELIIALSRAAVDPRSPLSPFGDGQKEIREKTIALFQELIATSDLKADKKLTPYLPTLLWMYLMGAIFFWVFDESAKQKKTEQLIEKLTPLVSRLIRFSRFPLTGSVMKPVLDVLKTVID
jgi:AcrR family transcriptional regulator